MVSSSEDPTEISEALKNESVAQLYGVIASRTPIKFSPSDDKLWGSQTSEGATTIYYAQAKRPAEAFAHELLHAELKIAGYRQYTVAVAKRPCPHRTVVRTLLGILDNELQHHRMTSRFRSLGFSLKSFYHDGDANSYKKVRRILAGMNGGNSTADFFTQFVTAIAPGGAGTDAERSQLKNYLKTRCNSRTAKRLDEIETVFARWASSDTFDAGPSIGEILRLMDLGCTFWVGASTAFPEDGFFIGDSFDLEEAER